MEKHCAEAEHPSNLNPQFPGSATPSGRPTRTPSSESTSRLTKDRPQAGTACPRHGEQSQPDKERPAAVTAPDLVRKAAQLHYAVMTRGLGAF